MAWLYAGQFATVIFQFAYAGFTSRLMQASEFGSYAVALAGSGLVSLLASGGASQAISRATELTAVTIKSLASLCLMTGFVGSIFLVATSRFWALVWGNPESELVEYYLALSVCLAPATSLYISVLRRQLKYRAIATAIFLTNLGGMAVGGICVYLLRTPESLTISLTISQCALLITLLCLVGRASLGLRNPKSASAEVGYSLSIIVVKLVEYVNGNLLKWGVSRYLGSGEIGNWNRSEVLTTVPFSHFQNAILQVVEPEFRHARLNKSKAKEAWTSTFQLVIWIFLPVGALAGAILPTIAPLLIGARWQLGVDVFVPLSFVGAFTVSMALLNSAVQSLGSFGRIWISHTFVVATQFLGILVLTNQMNLAFALRWTLVSLAIQHLIQIWQCVRLGLLDLRRMATAYSAAIAYSSALSISLTYLLSCLKINTQVDSFGTAVSITSSCVLLVIPFVFKSKLPFQNALRIAKGMIAG